MNKLDIKNNVKNFLNKNQIDDDALNFCILSVEQDIDARVRVMEMVLFSFATTKKDQDLYALPTDYLGIRDVELNGEKLRFITPYQGDVYTEREAYTLVGGYLKIYPKPSADSEINDNLKIIYYNKVPPLEMDNEVNWVSEKYPNIYIYGCLVNTEAYILEDDRIPYWKSRYDEEMNKMAVVAFDQQFSGGAPLDYMVRSGV